MRILFISQLLGVWVLADYLVQKGNSSSKCSIVELGPGIGTLAKDITRVSLCVHV